MARGATLFAKTILPPKPLIAEIGVYRGCHARSMCEVLDPAMIYLVDVKRTEFDMPYPHTFFEEPSQVAASHIPDESLDFVYIDALHDEMNMTIDIACWYPKLKVGGLIGGHDYKDDPNSTICRAVQHFFGKVDTKVVDTDWWHVKSIHNRYPW